MKVLSIYNENFNKYGKILEEYNYSELFKELGKISMPENGIIYIASKKDFEEKEEITAFQNRGFGGIPIQIGCVCGSNDVLNCLEYHKSSEFNIAMDDVILILGDLRKIKDGKFNTADCEAFLVPAGTGVELYSTTLHYAPIGKEGKAYRMLCVLPKGTNADKIPFEEKDNDDKTCYGVNKWILAHIDYNDNTIFKGLIGKNINISDLEF